MRNIFIIFICLYSYNDCIAEYGDPIMLLSNYSAAGHEYLRVSTCNRILVLGFYQEDSTEVESCVVSYELTRDNPGTVEVQRITDSTRVFCRPNLEEVNMKLRAKIDSLEMLVLTQRSFIDGTFSMGQDMASAYELVQTENDSLKTLLEMREAIVVVLVETGSGLLCVNKSLETIIDSLECRISELERAMAILPYHNGVLYIDRKMLNRTEDAIQDDALGRPKWYWPNWTSDLDGR